MVEPVAIGDEVVSAGFERARWIEARRSSLIACFCFLCSLSNRVTLCPVEDGLVWVLQGLTGRRIAPTNVLDEFLMTDVDCEAKKVTTVAILQEEEGYSQ